MLKLAVIGCGTIAQYLHIPHLKQIEDVEVVALCDIDAHRLSVASELVPTATLHTEYLDIIKSDNIAAVVIASEDVTHYRMVADTLRAKKHVFVEKPLCLEGDQAAELTRMARAAGRALSVGYQKLHDEALTALRKETSARAHPFLVNMRDICHDNSLVLADALPPRLLDPAFLAGGSDYSFSGEWESFAAVNLSGADPGLAATYRLFLNLACHDVSIMLALFGQPEEVVFADFQSTPECLAVVVFSYPSGGRVVLEAGVTSRYWFDQQIRAYWPDATATLTFPSPFQKGGLSVASLDYSRDQKQQGWSVASPAMDSFAREMRSFIDQAASERRVVDDGRHASHVLFWQLEAIERHMRSVARGE